MTKRYRDYKNITNVTQVCNFRPNYMVCNVLKFITKIKKCNMPSTKAKPQIYYKNVNFVIFL